MKILLLLLLILGIIGVTLFILYYMMQLMGQTNAAKMLQYGRDREFFIYEMLRTAFGADKVMKNLYFPVPTREGVFDTEIDIICVTRGGIAVIEVKGSKGIIDTPKEGRWCQRYGKKERYFENPHHQNQTHVMAVKRTLERFGISNVPIHNYVVFTDIKVRFTHQHPWLIRSDKLLETIENLDDKLILTRRDMKNITQIMRRHKKPRHTTFKVKFRRENHKKGKRR